MIRGMTTKIAISLPDELAAAARDAVRDGRADSVSAFVAAAINDKVRRDTWTELMHDLLAETGGPLTAAEIAATDEELRKAQWPA